jgi:hypothetical protein
MAGLPACTENMKKNILNFQLKAHWSLNRSLEQTIKIS